MNYAVGHNEPGYLPETEPFVFASFDDAKRHVIWDLKFWEDSAESEDEAEAYCHAAEDVNLWSPGENDINVWGRVFFIMTTDEPADL